MATHSCILAWRISWTEEPGELQSIRSQRVRHYLATEQQQHKVCIYIYGHENCVQYIFKAQYYTFWVNLRVFFNIFPPLEYKLDKRVYIALFPFSRMIPVTYYSLKQVHAQSLSRV